MNTDAQLMQRIALDPGVMAGQPVIQGTRLTVEYILNRLGHGDTIAALLEEFPGLQTSDVHACLLYASHALDLTETLPLSNRAA